MKAINVSLSFPIESISLIQPDITMCNIWLIWVSHDLLWPYNSSLLSHGNVNKSDCGHLGHWRCTNLQTFPLRTIIIIIIIITILTIRQTLGVCPVFTPLLPLYLFVYVAWKLPGLDIVPFSYNIDSFPLISRWLEVVETDLVKEYQW